MDIIGSGDLQAMLADISVEHEATPVGYFRVALEFAQGADSAQGISGGMEIPRLSLGL